LIEDFTAGGFFAENQSGDRNHDQQQG